MLNNESPILFADFYKPSHISMYSRDTEYVQDNMTPRNVKYFPHFADSDERILFGGLQGFLKWFLIEMFNKNFFELSKEDALAQYKEIMDISIGKDAVEMSGWEKLHDLGYLPLEIRALPEGTLSPVQVPVFTIQNTHPDFYWLPNYLETVISAETWKTITSATTAFQFKKLCLAAAERTGCGTDHVPFQAHEFAYRGQSGSHDAAQSGVGHLFSFSGTDTIPAIVYANRYYNMKGKFVAGSIPASEHSVATTNIGSTVAEFDKHELWSTISLDSKRYLAEQDFLKKYITELFPTGFVSYVADSYDFWSVITRMSSYLKPEIMARDGRVVFRPDSGVPEHIIAGYSWDGVDYSSWNMMDGGEQICNYEAVKVNGKFYKIVDCSYIDSGNEIPDHEIKGAVECLWEIFGGTVTDKGFKVLDSHVGLIYGDSITISRAKDIFQRLEEKGFASSNIVFGVGSYTTQYVTRDSLGFAVKATGAVIAGEQIMVVKEPKTDMGKKSAKGFLKVVRDDKGDLKLVDNLSMDDVQSEDNELRTVFKDGKLLVDEDLDTIRQRVNSQI